MDNFVIFALILVFRMISLFIVKSWFKRGEYLDNLEVAHHWTFGYGHLTEAWSEGVYSHVHPLGIAVLYKALAWIGLDHVDYLVLLPQIFQVLLTAFAKYCFYRWSKNNGWSLSLILTSCYWFIMAT